MGKYKTYGKYKDSGIPWLGEVPEHWEEVEIRRLFQNNKERNEGLVERNLLSLSYGQLKRKDIDKATGLVPSSFEGYQVLNAGYIVLRFTDLQNDKNSLRVGYVSERGIITNAYVGIIPKSNVDSKYYYYHLHFLDLIKHFYNGGSGVRQSLSYGEFSKEKVIYPTLAEQTAIAHFLDYKLSKINRFIRKKKQLIKLLNEQKAAIINQAVTKGLDPHVPMKDSGIEWLGEIPEHWEVRRLKYSVQLNQNKSFDSPKSENVKIALENIESKTGRILELHSNVFEGIGTIFKKGDVLFGKLRPYLAKAATPNFEGSCVNEILVLTPNKAVWHSEFLKYRILASDFISLVDNSTYGAKMPRANWDFIGSLKISRPSINEQLSIVDWIEEEHKNLDVIISKIEKEIALVEEYKTVLVAEAVTGKIDVRGFEVPEMESEEESYEEIEEEMSMAAEDAGEFEPEEAA